MVLNQRGAAIIGNSGPSFGRNRGSLYLCTRGIVHLDKMFPGDVEVGGTIDELRSGNVELARHPASPAAKYA